MIEEKNTKVFRDLDEKLMKNLLLKNEYERLEINFPNRRTKKRALNKFN